MPTQALIHVIEQFGYAVRTSAMTGTDRLQN
jgi:hypothetical protein